MSLTYSSMLDLGTNLIKFNLLNSLTGNKFSSDSIDKEKPTLIMFICNHCPYVIHYHRELIKFSNDYSKTVNMIAISSNDIVNYPEDSPEKMKEIWSKLGLSFPYLYDETQTIAKAYKAECTPEFYLFDTNRKLVYRGRLDESSPNSNIQPSGKDIRNALDNLFNDEEINNDQFPSMGCNIKWK